MIIYCTNIQLFWKIGNQEGNMVCNNNKDIEMQLLQVFNNIMIDLCSYLYNNKNLDCSNFLTENLIFILFSKIIENKKINLHEKKIFTKKEIFITNKAFFSQFYQSTTNYLNKINLDICLLANKISLENQLQENYQLPGLYNKSNEYIIINSLPSAYNKNIEQVLLNAVLEIVDPFVLSKIANQEYIIVFQDIIAQYRDYIQIITQFLKQLIYKYLYINKQTNMDFKLPNIVTDLSILLLDLLKNKQFMCIYSAIDILLKLYPKKKNVSNKTYMLYKNKLCIGSIVCNEKIGDIIYSSLNFANDSSKEIIKEGYWDLYEILSKYINKLLVIKNYTEDQKIELFYFITKIISIIEDR